MDSSLSVARPEERRRALMGLASTGLAGVAELRRLERLPDWHGPLEPGRGGGLGLSKGLVKALSERSALERGEVIEERTRTGKLDCITFEDGDYPDDLRHLANPPLVLWVKGRLPAMEARRVAVVGSRRCTRYAHRVASGLGRDLGRRGVAVISGLARGVDGAAHRGCLEGGGATFAVMGSGLARVYPPEHRDLVDAIVEKGGGVLTEFHPEAPPLPGNFPRRNRLIAAFSHALVLVEATRKSGGLITVRWACDLGREVFAVPGQVDNPGAEGTLALIRDGVRCVTSAADVLEDMGWRSEEDAESAASTSEPKPPAGRGRLNARQERVLALLDHEPCPLDDLLRGLEYSPGETLTLLLSLELEGWVAQEPGLRFRKLSRTEG